VWARTAIRIPHGKRFARNPGSDPEAEGRTEQQAPRVRIVHRARLALQPGDCGLDAVAVALPVGIWFAIRRTVEGYAQLTGGGPVQYEMDEQWLVSHYAPGSGELQWSAFKGVLKTDEAWLLLMAHEDRFIPLPVAQVPEDALRFIEARIEDAGGRATTGPRRRRAVR